MIIRSAAIEDIPAMTAIYNEVIANTNAIYTETPLTPDDRTAWMRARQAHRRPAARGTCLA